MKNKKGAIGFFALLAMMFFLIFIMVAYNNVSSKSKMQIATDDILLKKYTAIYDSDWYFNDIMNGDIKKSDNTTYLSKLKSTKERETIEGTTIDAGDSPKYIFLSGKIYKITN